MKYTYLGIKIKKYSSDLAQSYEVTNIKKKSNWESPLIWSRLKILAFN